MAKFDLAEVLGNTNIVNDPASAQRDVHTIAAEIRTLHRAAQGMVLSYVIEIGRRLTEAKEMLPYGQWGDYLKSEVDYSQRTANNYMQIFEEYGDKQASLFGDPKSQALANLPYTHAVKLLALPEEEREDFAEEHHVAELSSRELDKLIRERDEALKRADDSDAKNNAQAEEITELQAKLADNSDVKDLRDKLAAAEKYKSSTAAALEAANSARAKAEDAAKKAKEQLKALKEHPEIPDELLADIRKKEAESARSAAERDLAAKEDTVKEAERKASYAAEQLDALKKQLAMADPDSAVFRIYFTTVQEDLNRLHGAALKIRSDNPEKAEKLYAAVRAMLSKTTEVWQ